MFWPSPDEFHVEPQHHSQFPASVAQSHGQHPESQGYGTDYKSASTSMTDCLITHGWPSLTGLDSPQHLQQPNASNYYGYEEGVGSDAFPDATHFGGSGTPFARASRAPLSAYIAPQQMTQPYAGDRRPENWGRYADNVPIGQRTYATTDVVASDSITPYIAHAMLPTAHNPTNIHAPFPRFDYNPYSETFPVAAMHHHYHQSYIAAPPQSAPSTPFTDLSLDPSAEISAATTPEASAHAYVNEPAILYAGEVPGHPGWYHTPDGPDVVAQECLLDGGCCGHSGPLPRGKGDWTRHIRGKHPGLAETQKCDWPVCSQPKRKKCKYLDSCTHARQPCGQTLKGVALLSRHIGSVHVGQEKMLCLLCRDRARIAALQIYGDAIQADETISPSEKVEADMRILSQVEVRYTIKRNEKETRVKHATKCIKESLFQF